MKKFLCLILIFTFFALMTSSLVAQSRNGKLLGKVVNEMGKAIKGVVVTITSATNGNKMIRKTNKRGKYRFLSLKPDAYQIIFEKEGYQTHTINCLLKSQQIASLKIKMLKKKE